MPWIQGWGAWIWSPDGSVNSPGSYSVPVGQQGSTATTPPTTPGGAGSTIGAAPPGAVTSPTVPRSTTAVADSSAKGILDTALATYGLTSLSSWAWKKWQAGESIDQIFLELRSTPEYKTRFPAMAALSASGHAISTDAYIQLERSYTEIGRQYGLPSGFYDQPADFTKLIEGHVSATEYQQRVQDYSTLAFNTDPTIRAELDRLYGVDAGHIAAYFINPDKALPILQRQFGATQAATAAFRSGYGDLNLTNAESLSAIDPAQLAQGFGTLVTDKQLFNNLPGEAGYGIDTSQQLGAAFLGDANSQRAIEEAAARRKAQFQTGGGFTQSQQGMAGVG